MKRLPLNIYRTANGYIVSFRKLEAAKSEEVRVCQGAIGTVTMELNDDGRLALRLGLAIMKMTTAENESSEP